MSKPRWFWIFGLGGLALTLALVAEAGSLKVAKSVGELSLEDGRLASRLQAPKQAPHASNHGSTIAADREGLWIVERNAGALIRTDHAGEVKSTITLSAGLGELVLDDAQTRLFVADRGADRVIQYEIAGDVATPRSELKVAEPHGLALTPDGSTLLITSVADQELVAVEVATMKVKWRLEVGPEPRAVAVSPEGRWALVGFLTSETIVRVELSNQHVQWHSLAPRDHVQIDEPGAMIGPIDRAFEAVSRFEVPNDVGRRHVRSVFALGFVGDGIAVAAHHVAAPQMELRPDAEEEQESYGGGVAPIEYRFARITPPAADGLVDMDHHALSVHQPRALAYDPARDVLYIGGYGDDEIAALGLASREHPTLLWSASLGGGVACGIDGLAFAGDHVWAHCELARRVVRIDLTPGPEGAAVNPRATPIKSSKWVRGPELAASLRSDQIERGAELFRRGENESLGGGAGVLELPSRGPQRRSDVAAGSLDSADADLGRPRRGHRSIQVDR